MEISRKYLVTVLTLAAIAVALSSASFAVTLSVNNTVNELVTNTSELSQTVVKLSSETTAAEEEAMYMLKEYNGVIGVFDMSGVLTDIIDVEIKSLPEADRVMLSAGIPAHSNRELASLIEDYTG